MEPRAYASSLFGMALFYLDFSLLVALLATSSVTLAEVFQKVAEKTKKSAEVFQKSAEHVQILAKLKKNKAVEKLYKTI